jgi:NAD(P)-dependent dehydrogenase (short-subunit alcohol dehydrogenase family)
VGDTRVVAIDRRTNPDVEKMFPSVVFIELDIADTKSLEICVNRLESNGLLPDLCILNAATHSVDNDPFIRFGDFQEGIAVNMMSTINFLSCLMPKLKMKASFVFCSSGVIIFPNPTCLAYFISKLAITRTFDIFSDRYSNRGFVFKTVILGPINSDMLQESMIPKGLTGFLRRITTGDVEIAADKIVHFSKNKRRRLYYRRSSAVLLWCVRIMQALLPANLKLYRVDK